ncbi:hypothetical protein BC834DRAFT_863238 [Gloeopeniophorella convolvens]|nr:hypothetical protein BC834DRAFT_863238 [Gloeopeniophorella convolvens]
MTNGSQSPGSVTFCSTSCSLPTTATMSEDASSRILVVASTMETARQGVQRIKAFVGDSSDLPPSNAIPWTIRNRYYSANVHFHLAQCAPTLPQFAEPIPAVIFVWQRGQPYAEHIFDIAKSLARIDPDGPDAFLADHGFEYIDATRTARSADNDDGDDGEDVPQGLPRVVDALSTIMWPNMVRAPPTGNRASQMPMLFDVMHAAADGDAEADEEDTLAGLLAADATDHGAPQTRARRVQQEMAALERWLIENEELHDAELAEAGLDGARIHSDGEDADEPLRVPAVQVLSGDPWAASSPAPSAAGAADSAKPGFDDDFAAFVSAPAPALLTAQRLVPAHTGGSYRSLRSGTSEFASDADVDDDAGYEALDDRSTASREPGDAGWDADDDPRTPVRRGFPGAGDVPFDLTDILSTLQTMRADVAGVEDEAQRRAMTARFASEFVFRRMGGDNEAGAEVPGPAHS